MASGTTMWILSRSPTWSRTMHLHHRQNRSSLSLLQMQMIRRKTCHSDMRQADINRVVKAREHLKAATTLLSNIKWENVNGMEDLYLQQSKGSIQDADISLNSVIFIQDK